MNTRQEPVMLCQKQQLFLYYKKGISEFVSSFFGPYQELLAGKWLNLQVVNAVSSHDWIQNPQKERQPAQAADPYSIDADYLYHHIDAGFQMV